MRGDLKQDPYNRLMFKIKREYPLRMFRLLGLGYEDLPRLTTISVPDTFLRVRLPYALSSPAYISWNSHIKGNKTKTPLRPSLVRRFILWNSIFISTQKLQHDPVLQSRLHSSSSRVASTKQQQTKYECSWNIPLFIYE